jgi:hypothetical protein
MKKLGIVITDGVFVILLWGLTAEATKQFDSVTIYSGLPIKVPTKLVRNGWCQRINSFEEPKLTWF